MCMALKVILGLKTGHITSLHKDVFLAQDQGRAQKCWLQQLEQISKPHNHSTEHTDTCSLCMYIGVWIGFQNSSHSASSVCRISFDDPFSFHYLIRRLGKCDSFYFIFLFISEWSVMLYLPSKPFHLCFVPLFTPHWQKFRPIEMILICRWQMKTE